MTDRIDLDELADPTDDARAEDRPNRGDWLWREEGDPDDEPGIDEPAAEETGADELAIDESASDETGGTTETDSAPSRLDHAVPHVPRPNKDKPVGIPIEGGGAGGGRTRGQGSGASGASGDDPEAADDADGTDAGTTDAGPPSSTSARTAASGPHGGDADDMTMALTYGAARRLADPGRVFAEAAGWADWVGIVGDVDAPTINKFQRDEGVDVDFFNGSGTGPGERLAQIGPRSMFFAERMVVVGIEGGDEGIARAADWEFVPLETAAEKAGWALTE